MNQLKQDMAFMTTENRYIEQYKNKLTYLLKLATIVIAVASIAWSTFYFFIQNWLGVAMHGVLTVLGYMGYWHTKRNNTKIIADVYFPLMFIMVALVCIFLDVPTAVVARSNHYYFLPMALYAYVIYQDDHAYLKIGVPIFISIVFLVFASTHYGINLSEATSQHRLIAAWITNSIALIFLFLVALIMQSDFKMRHTLELELSNALLKDELVLYYQPQVNELGKTQGAEVLMRWFHPKLGTIPPDVFIPLAEKTDLILHLSKHVLVSACNQLAIWAKTNETAYLNLSVNISVKQFLDPDFVQNIIRIIDDSKIDAHKLQLEITESIFAHDLEDIKVKLAQLKARGVRLSLDDFGTGYSNLTYVKNLSLDELKIDKSFVKDVLSDGSAASITKMVISLAHELRITIIAEGVETHEQRQFLVDNGCLNFQGYLYSKPLPISEFNAFVLAHKSDSPSELTSWMMHAV